MSNAENPSFYFQELTELTGVKPYVLRYWEAEFPSIQPQVLEDGQKIYSQQDLEQLLRIKKYLFEEKLSIQEVKKIMLGEKENADVHNVKTPTASSSLSSLKDQLKNLLQDIRSVRSKYGW